jgi:hypothetical protein
MASPENSSITDRTYGSIGITSSVVPSAIRGDLLRPETLSGNWRPSRASVLSSGRLNGGGRARDGGLSVRPNASTVDKGALCTIGHYESGDPASLSRWMGELPRHLPHLDTLGRMLRNMGRTPRRNSPQRPRRPRPGQITTRRQDIDPAPQASLAFRSARH